MLMGDDSSRDGKENTPSTSKSGGGNLSSSAGINTSKDDDNISVHSLSSSYVSVDRFQFIRRMTVHLCW